MNKLYQKLTSVLRKSKGPNSNVVPFALGRIYSCVYRNWHHDPKPLVLILGSNAFYTVGINIHYLGGLESSLSRFIITMRNSKRVLTGLIMYKTLKMRQPAIPQRAFRKYFTSMLRGKLVSEGISTLPEPNKALFVNEPFVKRLNNRIHPPKLSFNKTTISDENRQEVRDQISTVKYGPDRQKPFANQGKSVVQYRPQGGE